MLDRLGLFFLGVGFVAVVLVGAIIRFPVRFDADAWSSLLGTWGLPGVFIAAAMLSLAVTAAKSLRRQLRGVASSDKHSHRPVWLDGTGWQFLLSVAQVGGVLLAIPALLIANRQTDLAIQSMSEQRIVSAWQILADPDIDGSGKIFALETIAATAERLTRVNLGCAVGAASCASEYELGGLRMISPNEMALFDGDFTATYLDGALFQGIEFYGPKFPMTRLDGAIFRDCIFYGTDFVQLQDDVTFDNCSFVNSDFSDTNFVALKFIDASFFDVNVSGVTFCANKFRCGEFDSGLLMEAWFYADNPPIGLEYIYPNLDLRAGCIRRVGAEGEFAECPEGTIKAADLAMSK